MEKSILVAISDSSSSRAVLNCMETLFLRDENVKITLCHIFRQPSASSELMGKKFTTKEAKRREGILLDARNRLVGGGFAPSRIDTLLASEPYPTVADGIIDQHKKCHYDIIVIGRKKMSKAEEFVMGDASVKLVRAIEDASILVVKTRQKEKMVRNDTESRKVVLGDPSFCGDRLKDGHKMLGSAIMFPGIHEKKFFHLAQGCDNLQAFGAVRPLE